MPTPLVSLLVVSIRERAAALSALLLSIDAQAVACGRARDIEVCTCVDNRGEASVGYKRNVLLDGAAGEYIAYIDDDDLLGPAYVQRVLAAADAGTDCASLVGSIRINGKDMPFYHSLAHTAWYQDAHGFYRPPNHLNLIKRAHVADIRFPEVNHGEDKEWSMAVMASGRLLTQTVIPDVIYFYTPGGSTLAAPGLVSSGTGRQTNRPAGLRGAQLRPVGRTR